MKTVNAAPETEIEVPIGIAVIEPTEIELALSKDGGVQELFTKLETQIAPIVFDVEDKRQRELAKSIAYSVSRSKTAFEGVVEQKKKVISDSIQEATNAIKDFNSKKKYFEKACDALRDSVKAPILEWEAAEDAKKNQYREKIAFLEGVKEILGAEELGTKFLQEKLAEVRAVVISEETFIEEFISQAKLAKFEAIEFLTEAIEKAGQIERVQEKQAAQAAEERAEREKQIAAQAAAQAEQRAAEQIRQAEERAKAAEQAAQRHAEEQQRQAAANKEHRDRVLHETVDSLCASGLVDEDTAKNLVKAIFKNEIKNLKIIF